MTARPALTNNSVPVLAQSCRGSWRPIRRRAWWCPTWWWLGWASGSPSAPGPPYASSTLRLWNTYRTSTSQRRCITLCLVRSCYWAFYIWEQPLGLLGSFVCVHPCSLRFIVQTFLLQQLSMKFFAFCSQSVTRQAPKPVWNLFAVTSCNHLISSNWNAALCWCRENVFSAGISVAAAAFASLFIASFHLNTASEMLLSFCFQCFKHICDHFCVNLA